jgi:hypothetical protein
VPATHDGATYIAKRRRGERVMVRVLHLESALPDVEHPVTIDTYAEESSGEVLGDSHDHSLKRCTMSMSVVSNDHVCSEQ